MIARIEGIEPARAGLFTRLIYAIAKRKMGQATGEAKLVEPVKIMARQPRLLIAMGQMDSALDKSAAIEPRHTNLAFTRTARMIGCPF